MKTYFAITRRNAGHFEMLMGMTCKAESREEAAAKITKDWIVKFGEAAFVDLICEVPEMEGPFCIFSMYMDTFEIHAQGVGNGYSVSQQIWQHVDIEHSLRRENEFEKA